jgi:hypothetical protein
MQIDIARSSPNWKRRSVEGQVQGMSELVDAQRASVDAALKSAEPLQERKSS